LDAYGSHHNSLLERVCETNARNNNICPKGKDVAEREAILRNKLYPLLDEVHETSDDYYNAWQAFPTSAGNLPSLPPSDMTQDMQVVGHTLFSLVNSAYGKQRDLMSIFTANQNFSDSRNNLVDQYLFTRNL
jgi:hypothetical protein